MLIDKRRFLGLIGGVFAGWHSISAAQHRPSVSGITFHTAAADGFFSNSYFLAGSDDTTLVDAQLTQQEAETVIGIIRSIGKPLESIIITHSHIDHYAGLEFIGPAFPEAVIYSTDKSIGQIAESSRYWPGFSNKLAALSSGRYRFSHFDLDCLVLPNAESISPLVLYFPEEQLLISGDHYLRDQHLWLAEGRAQQWLGNLDTLEHKWKIQWIYPGHGEPGGLELSDDVRGYINNFQNAVKSSDTIRIARRKLLEMYPDHRLKDVLEVSLLSAFANKTP